jgi:D-proline reductase (dithiol) PrdB
MPRIDELPFWLRALLRGYPWRRIEPVPLAQLRKPLSESRVALVTMAGLVPPGEPPFDAHARGGDVSWRLIGADASLALLADHHRSKSFDHAGMAADRNLALPLDRLRELAAERVIGEVAPRHFSFMGSITAPGRLVRETAPSVARMLMEDAVDAALLVPV